MNTTPCVPYNIICLYLFKFNPLPLLGDVVEEHHSMCSLVDVEEPGVQHLLIAFFLLLWLVEHLQDPSSPAALLLAPPLVHYIPYLYLHSVISHYIVK